MIFKKFRFVILFRIIILSFTIFLFLYLLNNTNLYAAFTIIAALIIYQIYLIIHYVEKTNRDLIRFLDAVKYEDFSQTFSGAQLGDSFNELKIAFSDIITKFQHTRAEKEEHYRYLQTVVQHVGIGVISYTQNGEVELINNAAKRILKISRINNIKSLNKFSKTLVNKLFTITAGEKDLIKIKKNDELIQLSIFATEFIIRNQKYTMVSIQNIANELEEKEMEAWQNLIRVLTHEIMNSITPISSLASTINNLLNKNSKQLHATELNKQSLYDIKEAAHIIEKRSEGLLLFVESYRELTRIPQPNFQIISVSSLFSRILHLMENDCINSKIEISSTIEPKSIELTADPVLIEQVLINLIRNAIEALKKQSNPFIQLTAVMNNEGRVVISIADNGSGIVRENIEKIFIPFFTTKEKGSGIGLSLCRQIMRLHRGAITVALKPDNKTEFLLRF